ncbi:MAG: hypothetical protein D6717_09225, partial [Gammaproteobacteria bacterium]
DLLRRSRPVLEAEAWHCLQQLTHAWQQVAYAHEQLPAEHLDRLEACRHALLETRAEEPA